MDQDTFNGGILAMLDILVRGVGLDPADRAAFDGHMAVLTGQAEPPAAEAEEATAKKK